MTWIAMMGNLVAVKALLSKVSDTTVILRKASENLGLSADIADQTFPDAGVAQLDDPGLGTRFVAITTLGQVVEKGDQRAICTVATRLGTRVGLSSRQQTTRPSKSMSR